MAAAHHPEEFVRKPRGAALLPARPGHAAYAVDPAVCVWLAQCVEPAVQRHGVVVEEDDDRSPRRVKSRVPCSGEPGLVVIGKDRDATEGIPAPAQECVIVVDDQEHLVPAPDLPEDRV
jgi:hypothetical protein